MLWYRATDNGLPLDAYMTALVACFAVEEDRWSLIVPLSVATLAMIGPVWAPFVLLALLLYRLRTEDPLLKGANRLVLRTIALGAGVTVLAPYGIPRALVRWKGYTDLSSPFLFRTGLDGDPTYLRHHVQAIINPFYPRPWIELVFPSTLLFAYLMLVGLKRDSAAKTWLGRALLFALVPYLALVTLFPQAVSIHPYLSDYTFQFPLLLLSVCGLFTPAALEKQKGPALLALLFLLLGMLSSQLVGVAQFARAALIPGH